MILRISTSIAVVGFFCLLASCQKKSTPPTPPAPSNVVVVVIDTLRRDHLTQYGYPRATSPALSGLDRESTRYERAYAPSSWTLPSTASIHTGLHPRTHGAITMGDVLESGHDRLAEILRAGGWSTVGLSANVHIGEKTGFARGFDEFRGHDGTALAYPDVQRLRDDALRWLSERDGSRPFFMYLHPMNVHGPYRVPAHARQSLLGRAPTRDFNYRRQPNNAILNGKLTDRELVTEPFLVSLSEQYDTAIRYTTDVIGEVFDRLRADGLWDNSWVVVTSDHGEELFDHGGFSHGYSLYEEVVRVPLWVKRPGQKQGSSEQRLTSLTDIFPTIVEGVGLEHDRVDGINLSRAVPGSRKLYFHVAGWEVRAVGSAIRSGDLKLISMERNYEGLRDARLLFDLGRDSGEKMNLAGGGTEHPAAKTLTGELGGYFREISSSTVNVEDELNREALEALGYIR